MFRRRMVSWFAGVCGTLLIVAGFAFVPPRPRPDSYRTAVVWALRDRGMDVRSVDVVDGCAPSYQMCRTYAGTVTVDIGRVVQGKIACTERWTTCTLSLPEAGIPGVPLADTRDPLVWRWEQWFTPFKLWLRELGVG